MQETDLINTSPTSSSSTTSNNEGTYRLRALLGGIAGLCMDSFLYPIDTVRTRMKANTQETVALFAQMKSMYKQEGIFSFVRGYSCVLTGSFFGNCLYFYMYEKLKHTFTNKEIFSKDAAPFVAAFLTGFTTSLTSVPFMVVKNRMQLEPGQYDYKHFFDGAKKIIKNEGFTKLYLGGSIFFFQAAVEISLTFGFYELFYRTLKPLFPTNRDFNIPLSMVSSVASAATTGMLTCPLDVIVTRLQIQDTKIHGTQSVPSMIKVIYKNEGLPGFMKGVTGTIWLYSLGSLVLFPTYEFLKGTFGVDLSK